MKARQALITGGTSGVGKQLVFAAAQRGYDVTFVGRHRGEELQRQLRITFPTVSTSFACVDLESPTDVKQFAEGYVLNSQRVDLLANVAGALYSSPPEGAVDRAFVVSCLSTLQLTQTLLPKLKEAPGARIINVGASPRVVLHKSMDLRELESTGQLTTADGRKRSYSPFTASALAVHAKVVLTQCLAEQLKESGVTVNAFHPGAIRSGLYRGLTGPSRWAFLAAQPFLRRESATANRAAFAAQEPPVSGTLLVGEQALPLKFQREYVARMWDVTQTLLSNALAAR